MKLDLGVINEVVEQL